MLLNDNSLTLHNHRDVDLMKKGIMYSTPPQKLTVPFLAKFQMHKSSTLMAEAQPEA